MATEQLGNRDPAARTPVAHENRALPYLALFSSVGTLLCCALPSLLVVLGFSATVASGLSAAPWLVTLSRHKAWLFAGTTFLLAVDFYYVYRLAPRLLVAGGACPADDPAACARATRVSRVVLWLSVALFTIGFSVAYLLSWALLRLEA